MKQKAKNKNPQLNVAALCLLHAKISCSAIKRQRKAIKKGKREKRHGSLAAKKISFKDYPKGVVHY